MPKPPGRFNPKDVAALLRQNKQLRSDLDAVQRTADELNERIRSMLEVSAEQDAERRDISGDIRRRLKQDVANDSSSGSGQRRRSRPGN